MEDLFVLVKDVVLTKNSLLSFPMVNQSHIKKSLLHIEREGLKLNVELIYFTGVCWTGAHTHPEYMVEEVLEGTLHEQEFVSSKPLLKGQQQLRNKGHYRSQFDPQGHPHNVIGYRGTSLVLCLTYGKNSVTPI